MSFEVSLDQFSGPLPLLLQLVEQEDLPLSELSLARVADAYIAYVRAHEPPPEELADFLVIASRLLFLKSQVLLPEVEQEALDQSGLIPLLERYRLFVDAVKHVDRLARAQRVSYAKSTPTFPEIPKGFSPPPSLAALDLHEAMKHVLQRLRPFAALRQVSLERVATLEERIDELLAALARHGKVFFHDFHRGITHRRADVVVSFLALLELVRQGSIDASQRELFGDMTLQSRQNTI